MADYFSLHQQVLFQYMYDLIWMIFAENMGVSNNITMIKWYNNDISINILEILFCVAVSPRQSG